MLFTLIVSLLTMVYVIPLISPWSPMSAQSLALIVTPFSARYRGLSLEKLAVITSLLSMVSSSGLDVLFSVPDQFEKINSLFGVAVTITVVPSGYVPPAVSTIPPSLADTVSVKVYLS